MTSIFVFGSNLAGRHGKGAALTAVQKYGAIYGQGFGIQGRSFAIPTKDERLMVLPLHSIAEYIRKFVMYAELRSDLEFHITPVGCGLAGYKREQVRPLFTGTSRNCTFAATWSEKD